MRKLVFFLAAFALTFVANAQKKVYLIGDIVVSEEAFNAIPADKILDKKSVNADTVVYVKVFLKESNRKELNPKPTTISFEDAETRE